jgi:hypothetical protein
MTAVFAGAVDLTFAAFGINTLYTPAGGEPIGVRVIARRPDTIIGFGETRIHARAPPSSCGRARSRTLVPAISLPSARRASSSRASRSGAIRIGSCGHLTCGLPELARCTLLAKNSASSLRPRECRQACDEESNR